jgi:hypothetical protein
MLASVVLADSLALLIFSSSFHICTHLATRLFATAHHFALRGVEEIQHVGK